NTSDCELARYAEKLRSNLRSVKSLAEQTGEHRDQSEKNRARESKSGHCVIEEIRCRFARSHPRNIAAMFLQIIGYLCWLKLRRHPKIAEKENHRRQQQIVRPTIIESTDDFAGRWTISTYPADDR